MARIRVSLAARADLASIYRYSSATFGIKRADTYSAGLRQAIKALAEFPEAGAARGDPGRSFRVKPFGSHIVIYVSEADLVNVLRIRHAAEDWADDTFGDDQ